MKITKIVTFTHYAPIKWMETKSLFFLNSVVSVNDVFLVRLINLFFCSSNLNEKSGFVTINEMIKWHLPSEFVEWCCWWCAWWPSCGREWCCICGYCDSGSLDWITRSPFKWFVVEKMPSRAAVQMNTNRKPRIIMLITANIDDIRCLERVDILFCSCCCWWWWWWWWLIILLYIPNIP